MKNFYGGRIVKLFCAMVLMKFTLTGCEKYELDRQMQALCEKDGGNKAYETVALPANMFSESGQPFPDMESHLPEGKFGNEYLYIREVTVLKNGDPFRGRGRLTKSHIKIVRKSDSKVLGESVEFSRAGGDGFVIGHPTANSCAHGSGPIEKIVFVKK